MSREDERAEPPSNDRLLEIASNMKVQCYELGPLDREDIRAAVLELLRVRNHAAPAGETAPLLEAAS